MRGGGGGGGGGGGDDGTVGLGAAGGGGTGAAGGANEGDHHLVRDVERFDQDVLAGLQTARIVDEKLGELRMSRVHPRSVTIRQGARVGRVDGGRTTE